MPSNKWIGLVKTIPVYLTILFGLQLNSAIATTKTLARSEPLGDRVLRQPSNPTLEQQRQQLRERQQQIREEYRQEWNQQQQEWRNQRKKQQQESREYRRQNRERIYQHNELRREQEQKRRTRQLILPSSR